MTDRPLLVIATGTFPDPDAVVERYRDRCALRVADLADPAATYGAAAVVVATHALDAPALRGLAPSVRAIGRTGVGLDSIDLDTCAELGITVVNQPGYGATEVATQAVAMLLALQRRLPYSDRFVRGGWQGPFALTPLAPLDELTLGLVGCGRIGAETARLAAPLVREVIAYDPYARRLPPGVRQVDDLDALLDRSALVSVHSPLTDATRGLLGRAELGRLPAGAVVVNVARGGIVDEDALAELLVSGHLGGAGLDVFGTEPLPAGSPLLAAPNTLFSPHVAAYSERSMWRLASWTVEDLLGWLGQGGIEHGNLAVRGSR
jgi:phosphoglycerate dehydrogenase-like enzyme